MIAFHLIYIGNTYPVAKQLVYTFHMPGFLLVSGYLFNVRKSWSRVGHTLLWILIPYAVMETGYTVMASLLPIREHIDHLSAGLLLNKIFLHPIGPYWYLHTLMLCGASYYICFCVPRLPWQGKAALLAVLLGVLSLGCGLLSWANAAYFFVGVLIRQSVVDFRKAFLLGGGLSFLWWHYAWIIAIMIVLPLQEQASYTSLSVCCCGFFTFLFMLHCAVFCFSLGVTHFLCCSFHLFSPCLPRVIRHFFCNLILRECFSSSSVFRLPLQALLLSLG